jgi:hypothetical protein
LRENSTNKLLFSRNTFEIDFVHSNPSVKEADLRRVSNNMKNSIQSHTPYMYIEREKTREMGKYGPLNTLDVD